MMDVAALESDGTVHDGGADPPMSPDGHTPLTAPGEAARLRELGFNIIPIRAGSKMPRAGEGDIVAWRAEGCSVEILDTDNIAMLHGGIGGTWAMDCDNPSILKDLLTDYGKAPKLCVVKTPKQGHHLIFKQDPADPPLGDFKFEDHGGRKIDIKAKGYTLLPPSLHPDEYLGRYRYLFDTNVPNIRMRWSNALGVLHGRGFFSPSDKDEMMSDAMSGRFGGGGGQMAGGDGQSKYDYNELLEGGFGVGERRRKQNSLYVKKRIMGSTEEDAKLAVLRINATCNPPLPDREVRDNIRASEKFFEWHKDEINRKYQEKMHQQRSGGGGAVAAAGDGSVPGGAAAAGTGAGGVGGGGPRRRNALDPHTCADTVMHETNYIGHPSGEIYYYANGIWIKGGEHKLRKSCELRWRDQGITHSQIREIEELVRIRTAIVPDGSNEDVFDLDATKIVLLNGTYDLKREELVEHSPEHMATIRHPITYDTTAGCPVFERAMQGWFDDDKYRTIILEMFALSMLRKNVIQKGYVHYGKGSNGKSTCLAVLRHMLGRQNTASIEMQSFEDSRFIGDTLYGKSANIASDGGTQPLVKTGLIKAVLGGDSITCEPKFKKAFVFQPFATLIFTFNELPPVLDSSDGFARKIQLVPWNNRFTRADREIAVLSNDESERSGIFNRVVPIMRRFLLDDGEPEYEDEVEQTQNLWMRRSDSFYLFREEYMIIGKGRKGEEYKIEVNKLNTEYIQACSEHGMTPLPKNEFFSRVSELLGGKKPAATRVNGENLRVWKGLTIRSELRPDGQATLEGGGGGAGAGAADAGGGDK